MDPDSAPPLEEILNRVKSVKWSKLQHAYGKAPDVPDLISVAITGADGDAREQAWRELEGSLAHQGSVYSASAKAAAFMVELLPHSQDKVRHIMFLADLALGDAEEISLFGLPDLSQLQRTQDNRPILDCAEAVEGAAETLRNWVGNSDDQAVQSAALFLLSFLPTSATETVQLLKEILQTGAEWLRPIAALGLSQLDPDSAAEILTEVVLESEGLLHDASLLGLVMIHGQDTDDQLCSKLLDLSNRNENVDASRFPWGRGDLSRFAKLLVERFELQSVKQMLMELRQAEGPDFMRYKSILADRLFDRSIDLPLRLVTDLNGNQREFVAIVCEYGKDRDFVNATWPHLQSHGLFLTSSNLNRWFEPDPNSPFEAKIQGLPLWKWMSDVLREHRNWNDARPEISDLPQEVVPELLRQARQTEETWLPYELERPRPSHVTHEGRLASEQAYLDRYVEVLSSIAAHGGSSAFQAVEELGDRAIQLSESGAFPDVIDCAIAARVFVAEGRANDPRVGKWVQELLNAPPSLRVPKSAETTLAALDDPTKEQIVLSLCKVWQESGYSVGDESWTTMRFNDSLRFGKLLEPPPTALIQHVIDAIERWSFIWKQTPKGYPKPSLPKQEFEEWFAHVGSGAIPLIEASIAKKHRGAGYLKKVLQKLKSPELTSP